MSEAPTPPPAALAPERDVWQVAFGAIREMQRSGESAEMCARWIAERLAAPPPARAEAPEGAHREWKPRDEVLLRATVQKLCDFVWHRRASEHLWTIPVDTERDFDCILHDGIDELVRLRADNARLTQALELERIISASRLSTREIDVRVIDALTDANAKLTAERDQQAGALGRLREALVELWRFAPCKCQWSGEQRTYTCKPCEIYAAALAVAPEEKEEKTDGN